MLCREDDLDFLVAVGQIVVVFVLGRIRVLGCVGGRGRGLGR
jgi:hypothetical protein